VKRELKTILNRFPLRYHLARFSACPKMTLAELSPKQQTTMTPLKP
jgi:hypothetical protein